MKKTYVHYLRDLNEYIDRVIEAVDKIPENDFSRDTVLQDALLRRIEIIGEIAKKLPKSFRDKHNNIPWRDIAGTRDIIAHDYDGVNLHRVWLIAKRDIPKLKPKIHELVLEVEK